VTARGQTGAVIVGVDGTERSIDALALADRLAAELRRPVVIAYVHPYGELASVFSEGDYERLVREVAEATFDQIREHLPSVPERRLQLVTEASPAAGLHAMAEREGAALTVIGSSNRSKIGRILVGGTGERLLSGAATPVAVAPAGYAATARTVKVVGCGFDGSEESRRALAWTGAFARAASARLRVLSVYERTLPASLAVGGGLATASLNDVLRRRFEKEVTSAVSELCPTSTSVIRCSMATPNTSSPANQVTWTSWWWAPGATGRCAQCCSAVFRRRWFGRHSPHSSSCPGARTTSPHITGPRAHAGSRSGSARRGCACRASRARWPGGDRLSSC
jgi:nucleotide-binding universal stress UspA family protein